ncbi:hypothetical protein QFC22_001158 [Naganishia vaughanmartiniae]|uniref:Uncharacterized protein n=1 Tax=Naganishia vaughanmartiniae TaxID=1424756 RepID=A0ACC2XK35_9TREE|nr:hypothetical protein QFC22_001158 [Naganishia vaughanmartiniae]
MSHSAAPCLAVPPQEDHQRVSYTKKMSNRTGGEKRKRCAYDDGIRGPTDHQSYIFAEPITSRTSYRLKTASTSSKPLQKGIYPPAEKESRDERQSSSTSCRHPSSTSRRDIPVSLSVPSARQEYRSISLCNQGRQRESSTFSSRSSTVGKESLPKTKRKSIAASGSSSTQYSPAPHDSSARTGPSSSSSLLPAHLRPSAVSDHDLLSAERYASSLRLLATWESIALKYADIDPEEDAEIDIATGRIVRGKEKVARMPDRVIGGLSGNDEEAKELRTSGNPIRAKADISNCQQTSESLASELESAGQSPLQDEEESDESDIDELDTWDKGEMEIQVEALPLSHTTKPRSHRPWTADDDVDLQEFMRAEERRRALFGDIDEEEERQQEEEEEGTSVSARVMDKEEAMSRRTIHASSPYFPPDDQAPRSKTKQYAVSPKGFFDGPHRGDKGQSEKASFENVRLDTRSVTRDVEDDFERLFATPSQLPILDRCNPIFEESCASSASPLIPHIVEDAPAFPRQSSPSSASSYLVTQPTDEANSSNEGSINQKYNQSRDLCTSPRVNEEDICESALLNSSPAEPDGLEDEVDDLEFASAIYAEPAKQIIFSKEKRNLDNDEARYTPNYSIKLVVEVPIRDHRAFGFGTDPFPSISPTYEGPIEGDQSGLRRSSRHAAQGKFCALRKKRNLRPVQRNQSSDEDQTSLKDDDDFSVTRPLMEFASPLPEAAKEIPANATEVKVPHISTNRSRSPSVVEGTPEPSTSQSPRSLDLSSTFEYLLEHDRQATTSSLKCRTTMIGDSAQEEVVIHQKTTPAAVQDGLDGFVSLRQPRSMSPIAPFKQSASQLQNSAANVKERFSHLCDTHDLEQALFSQDTNGDSGRIGQPPSSAAQLPEATFPSTLNDVTDIEDDEDILLLGATFEDETEVIWPEVKPDLALADVIPPVLSEDPSTGCEMSFRSVKGEKQELSTFTAPFRCSRIIDLTGDDICDDDEHDELDDW